MVSSIDSTAAQGALPSVFSTTTSSVSDSSFAQQLETVLEQILGNSGNGSQFEIDVQPANSQSSSGNQFIVTVKGISAAPAGTPPSTTSPTAPQTPAPASEATTTSNPYVQVPFGSQLISTPSLSAQEAANDVEMSDPIYTPQTILYEDQISAAGDPKTGQTVPGTNLEWNDLTHDQQLAYNYALDWGFPAGMTMQQFLDAHVGPQIMANAPNNNPYLFGNK